MIKLITQFDNEKTKMSLATPTCGGCCCCCCCCIVSTFAAASISARNFGNYVAKQLPNEPKKIKYARNSGFWFPIGFLICLLFGLLFYPKIGSNSIIVSNTIAILYLFVMMKELMQKLNLPGIILRVIGFLILLGIFEVLGFFLGMYVFLVFNVYYLIGAIIVSIILICWAFGKNYDNLGKKKNNDDNLNIPEEKK